MHSIRLASDALRDLRKYPAYHRAKILDEIEMQLSHEPTAPTRSRKLLVNLVPPWEAEPPIWELRIGEFRVFYDVSEDKEDGLRQSRAQKAGRPIHGGNSMRTVSVRELQSSIKECVDYSQKDRIVVTQHGEPSAVIIGIKGMDWESVVMETSAPFWKMIRKRRSQPTLSLAEAKARVSTGRRKNGKT